MDSSKIKHIVNYYLNGNIMQEAYTLNGLSHNPDGPCYKCYYENGQLKSEDYKINGLYHNPNGAAIRDFYQNGQLVYKAFYFNNVKYTSFEKLQQAVKLNNLK